MSFSNPWNLKGLADNTSDLARRKTSQFVSPWATKFSFDPRRISVFNPLGRKSIGGNELFDGEEEDIRSGLDLPDKKTDLLRMGTAFFLAVSFGLSIAIVVTLLRA